MWSKICSFFGSFFHNVASDPMSTVKGVVQLAAAGATCYGMATGIVPINTVSTGFAASAAVGGLHAMGSDNVTVVNAIATASQMTPAVMTITDHVKAIQAQAGSAQAVMAAVADAQSLLAQVAPTAAQPVPIPAQ